MLIFNNRCFITCQSCCRTMSKVDRHQRAVAVECTHFMSRKCSCKLPACGHRLRETVPACESYYQSQQFQEGVNGRELPCVSGSIRARCTGSAESQLLSATHCTACVCGSNEPENLVHFVRPGPSVNDARADLSYTQHCCTCVQSLGRSSCQGGVTLSSVAASLCPHCTKFAQVNTSQKRDIQLTSRHSDTDLYSIHEEQEKTVTNPRHGSVIMDVKEWQRRHIEHLDRQKLEVHCLYMKFFV